MEQLLEESKQQLLHPLGNTRRKLLLLLNITYVILTPAFLISEKMTSGKFVNDDRLYFVYGSAVLFNFISLIYNLRFFRKATKETDRTFPDKNQKRLDLFLGYSSLIPILVMSFFNLIGFGNPFNDSILTDFALAQSLLIVTVMIGGRTTLAIWFITVLTLLFWNVSKRGWDYQYNYATPTEVSRYEQALNNNEPWALERKAELEKAQLNPPKITRYFNVWMVFLIVSFLVAYYFSGITLDILKIVPSVITNIEQASEQTKRMELEQKANEERTNTFINLAHETKTPLTLINNYLEEYVRKNGTNDDIEIIKWNVQRLTTDIVNFFDIERFNKGFAIYDHNQVTNLSDLLSNRISLFKSYASNKGIEIHEKIEKDCFVLANAGAIDRVINNIIENAIKFTPENGQVIISLYDRNDNLIFSVADNGVGIPAKYHSRVFEPYFQLGSNKKSNEGMGMGLSIVKKIVDDIKGEITLQSEPNQGTKITVVFSPFTPSEDQHEITDEPTKKLNPSISTSIIVQDKIQDESHPFILIVEDNINMLNYLLESLAPKYNVYAAKNGEEALEKLKSIAQLDLIVSDVMMDGMDGFDFCKTVSANNKYAHIPFIFLTAKTTQLDKTKGLQLGAIDYIEKPFLVSHLISKIESVLGNLNRQRSAVISKAYKSILADQDIDFVMESKPSDLLAPNVKKYGLTLREIEIIGLITKGLPYKVIANTLNISERTVGKHVSNIFSKLSVTNKLELIHKLENPTA